MPAMSDPIEVWESPQPDDHPELRTGEAGWVWIGPAGELETNTRVSLTPNSTHALLGHGVVDALNELPIEMGPLGVGRDILIPQAALDDASEILYEADRKTYGATWEFPLVREVSRELWLRIDNREYQRSLARLQDLVSAASRSGHAVRMRI
jgi:hypothetical protein